MQGNFLLLVCILRGYMLKCNMGMLSQPHVRPSGNFMTMSCSNTKCQKTQEGLVLFGCQQGFRVYISRLLTDPSCTQIGQVLLVFFLALRWLASPFKRRSKVKLRLGLKEKFHSTEEYSWLSPCNIVIYLKKIRILSQIRGLYYFRNLSFL